MLWFLKFLRLLPRGILEFRKEYKLAKMCQKIEKKHGPIVSAMYMYTKMDENIRHILIRDLLLWVQSNGYVESNEAASEWFLNECEKLGYIEPLEPIEKPVDNEAWREWELQE